MSKKENALRRNGYIKYSIIDHLSKYKWVYLFFGICIIVGLTVGFIVGFNRADNFALKDLPDTILVSFINKEASGFSLFFSRFFSFLCVLVLLWCLSCRGFLSWISFVVVLYQSFLLGLNCSILISIYKLGGVINVFVVIFPIHLIALILLMIWGVVCFYACLNQKNCGYGIFSTNFLMEHRFLFLLVLILGVVCFILESIILPHFVTPLFIGS